MSALIGLVGLGFILASFIGIIKPSFIKQSTRKRVLAFVLFPGIIIFTVDVYLTPQSIDPEYSPNQSASNLKADKSSVENLANLSPKRGKFDIDKIANQEKAIVNEYLGNPKGCETFESSERCNYDWLGTEIYFDKANKTPRTIIISELPSIKFSTKALKSIGLKIKSKPTFSNDSVIKWDYVNGKEISILSDKNNVGKVSNIQIRNYKILDNHKYYFY